MWHPRPGPPAPLINTPFCSASFRRTNSPPKGISNANAARLLLMDISAASEVSASQSSENTVVHASSCMFGIVSLRRSDNVGPVVREVCESGALTEPANLLSSFCCRSLAPSKSTSASTSRKEVLLGLEGPPRGQCGGAFGKLGKLKAPSLPLIPDTKGPRFLWGHGKKGDPTSDQH